MRILIIIDAFTFGGAQKVILTLIPEWVKLGCKIEMVLIQNNVLELQLKSLEDLGIQIHRISATNMFDFRAMGSLVRLAMRFKPSHIQAHLYWSQIWGVLPKIIVPGSRLFWVEHNTYLNRSRLQWMLFRIMAIFTKGIISVSFEVKEYLRVRKIFSTDVIPNPISNVFTYKPGTKRSNTFVFLGRLNEQKNPKLAISAFEFAKVNGLIGDNSRLILGGDGPLLDSLRIYAVGLQSRESITFAGQLTEGQTVDLLQSSISLVSTSKFEGFSLVRVEALATGATVISTRTGGVNGILTVSPNSELLISGVILTEPDVVEIANSMSAVTSPLFWSDSSINERVKAGERHTAGKVARDYLVSFNKTDLTEDLG